MPKASSKNNTASNEKSVPPPIPRRPSSKVMSVPLMKKMMGEAWYARNRCGINTMVAVAWGAGVQQKRLIHVTLTRVAEKPCLLSIEVTKSVIKDVFGAAIAAGELDELGFILDNGRHYSSYQWLSYTMLTVPDKYRITCSTTFGQANHMKGPADGTGGMLTRYRKAALIDGDICDEHQLKEAYESQHKRHLENDPDGDGFMCSVFLPGPKMQCLATLHKLDVSSLPVRLREAHQWVSIINDVRLKQNRNRQLIGKARQLSGLNIYAFQLPDDKETRHVALGGGKNPVMLAADSWALAEDIDEPDVGDTDEAAVLNANVTLHHDWKVSYRNAKGMIEKLSVSKVRANLKTSYNIFGKFATGAGRRHTPTDHAKLLRSAKDGNKKKTKAASVKRTIIKAR